MAVKLLRSSPTPAATARVVVTVLFAVADVCSALTRSLIVLAVSRSVLEKTLIVSTP